MTDWNRIAREKAAHRKLSAERPLEEKLRTLDRLRERSTSMRIETPPRPKDTLQGRVSETSVRSTKLTIFGAGATLVASARPTKTTTSAAFFVGKDTR